MAARVVIFDAYGTLFDVNAAARAAATEDPMLADIWPGLAADWRAKQLEYSWLRTIAKDYVSFRQVTEDGLDWALENAGLTDPALRAKLLALYEQLSPYPEARGCLDAVKAAGLDTGILSNGSPDMLGAAVDASGLDAVLDAVLSVDGLRVFKPARDVYDMVGARFGTRPAEVVFVSSNGWDVTHAAAYGFHAVWVNRGDAPVDRVGAPPSHVLTDLSGVPTIAAAI